MDMEAMEQRVQLLKALAHPHRLCIVQGLRAHRCSVGQIQRKLGLSQSGLSQHLAKLKAAGVIRGVRQGKEICYELVSGRAALIADMLTSDLIDPKECGDMGERR